MNLILEVFVASALSDRLRYHCRQTTLTDPASDPDHVVRRMVEGEHFDFPRIASGRYLSHSTSWRYEASGAIVLTYFVCADSIDFDTSESREFGIDELAIASSSDARTPRPRRVGEKQVLSHAIRHMAFLLQHEDRPTLKSAMSRQSADFFLSAEAAIAGRLV